MKNPDDQYIGGSLIIPDGYFVYDVDLDVTEPYCIIRNDNDDKIKKLIPKSLAYYLTTHHNGSDILYNHIQIKAKNELRRQLQNLLKPEKETN